MDQEIDIRETILEEFSILGINLDESLIQKCTDICNKYLLSPESFVNQWFAFTTSNLNGALPTSENLELMEKKLFKSNAIGKNAVNTPKSHKKFGKENFKESPARQVASPATNAKNNFNTNSSPKTPIRKNESILHEITDSLNDTQMYPSPQVQLDNYTQRKDSRSVLLSYGDVPTQFQRQHDLDLSIDWCNGANEFDSYMYMAETLPKRRLALQRNMYEVGRQIVKNTFQKDKSNQKKERIHVVGRILSEDSEQKLNSDSILLERIRGDLVRLQLRELKSCSLFPGQIVFAEGMYLNTREESNKILAVNAIYGDGCAELPQRAPVMSKSIEIVLACGPFTLPSNLAYDTLNDLLKYVIEYKSHLLILIGPFIPSQHENVIDDTFVQSFESFFDILVDTIMTQLENTNTQVVIIPSAQDAHAHPVYPTPPYKIGKKYENLLIVSDPGVVNIDGLLIGATSIDVVADIGKFEYYFNTNYTKSDRMQRIASYILEQRNFYPVFPPNQDTCVDYTILQKLECFKTIPHLLILPSKLRYFIKESHGCLVVNPEKLTKGYGAGSFARIEIQPGASRSICQRTKCEILKI